MSTTRWRHPLPYAALLFDADGTLRRCTIPGQPCPNDVNEWELLPHVREILALYDWTRIGISVVSNQGGIGLGYLTEPMARFLLQECLAVAVGVPIGTGQVLLCPHAPRDGCPCRKPNPKMLLDAEMFWYSKGIVHGPQSCLYVGDRPEDEEAARAAGFPFMWAKDFFGWEGTP